MKKVELIYDKDCPNLDDARSLLRKAFTEIGLEGVWQEWDRGAEDSPRYARQYGSPTILVDGKDVAGLEPSDGGNCCRVYLDGSGKFKGTPSIESITKALSRAA